MIVIDCEIIPRHGAWFVYVTLENGDALPIIAYDPQEVCYMANRFIGLTLEEAKA